MSVIARKKILVFKKKIPRNDSILQKNWTVNIIRLVANCDFYFRLYCYFPVHCTIVLHCCDFSWSSCFSVFLHYQLVDVSVFVVSKGKPVQTEGRKNIWLGHLNSKFYHTLSARTLSQLFVRIAVVRPQIPRYDNFSFPYSTSTFLMNFSELFWWKRIFPNPYLEKYRKF